MKFREMLKTNYRLLILVFLAFLLMVLVSYFAISTIMHNQLDASAAQNLKIAEATIKSILMEPEITIINSSLSIQHMIENGEGTEAIGEYLVSLTDWLLLHKDIISGFNGMYGYIFEEFLDGLRWEPPEGYSPQDRPWYISAMEANGDIVLTTPYVDAQTNEPIVTVAQAVYGADETFIGVLALDMRVVKLVEYVRGLKLTDSGYGIMVDSEMNIFAHPDDEIIYTNVLDVYPEFEQILQDTSDQMSKLSLTGTDGEQEILFTERLDNGWYISLVTPMQSFYADILYVLLILTVLGLVLMVILDCFLLRLSREKMRSDHENMSKSSFLANMSHEIRTPMNAIIGMSEIALREPDIPPSLTEHIIGIRQSSAALLSLINDILDFSKIEAGRLEIIEAPYIFASLVNDVLSIARTRLADKQVLFVCNIDCNVPNHLVGDALRVRQVILNILNNAIKYTQAGHVSLVVDCKIVGDRTAVFSISISDSGIGIRTEDLDKLFKDFSQVDTRRNREIEGTGLGLAIASQLCKAMGGTIDVRSEYGKGSTFTVTLPQRFDKYEKLAEVQAPDSKSVLIYEPREIYATSIICTIDNLGVDSTLAHSHSSFLEELEKRTFSHVFVSSFLYESAKNILSRMETNAQLVLLAEFGEITIQKDIRVIAMPVHAVPVANILNNVSTQTVYHEQVDHEFLFVAPTAKVLIVDDIETNLKVTAGLLSPYQMMVDTTKTGVEAIDLVKQNKYDLVFMDHMMPGMDGLEATMHIRALGELSDYYTRLPIVALTANAITGMKEMFLNNGFDDFLAKPIETSQLYTILEKWIPKEKRTVYTAPLVTKKKAEIIIKRLDTARGIAMTGGSIDNYMQTLAVFAKDGNEKLVQIKQNLIDEDISLFTINVHALKSASASIGATKLSEMASHMEIAGKTEDMNAIHSRLEPFFRELSGVLESIRRYLDSMEQTAASGGAITEDTACLKEALATLKESLLVIDIASIDNIMKSLREKQWMPSTQMKLEKISESILLFDYDVAVELIVEMMRVR